MEQLNSLNTNLTLNKSQKKLIELIMRISKKKQLTESSNLQKVHQFATALLNLSMSYKAQKDQMNRNQNTRSTMLKISKQADSLRLLLSSLSTDQLAILNKEQRRAFDKHFYKNAPSIEEDFGDCSSPIQATELISKLDWLCQASDALSGKGPIGRKELLLESSIAKEFLFICHRYGQLQVTVSNSLSEKKKVNERSSESDAVQCLSAVFENGGDSTTQATRSARTQLRKLREGFTYVMESTEEDEQYYESARYWVDFTGAKDDSPLASLPNFVPTNDRPC